MGVSLSVVCAVLLIVGIYALLFFGGAFEDPAVPWGAGFLVFVLAHGGAVSVEAAQVSELLGLGGSATLGLPITSFVLLPFLAALLLGRVLAGRVGNAWFFVLSAAFSYAVLVSLVAFLGFVSAGEGQEEVRIAAEPLSAAALSFLWMGLATFVAAGPMLPALPRQILRGTVVAAATGALLAVAITVVLLFVTWDGSALGAAAPPDASTGDLLVGVGALFTLLPATLGNLWLMAHGLPFGLHGLPDIGGVPLLGEALEGADFTPSLFGAWSFGWEWLALLVAPLVGLFLGGMVAAGGARGAHRLWQGALVAIPYTALAALVALLAGASLAVSSAGVDFEVALRASLLWMIPLPLVGAILGALGGLLSGGWAAFAPRPNLAFASTAALAGVVLLASLPVFAASSIPQNALPTDPLSFGGPTGEEVPETTFPENTEENPPPEDEPESPEPPPEGFSGVSEQGFIDEYYEAVGAEDWVATYYLLDYESRLEFTEDEWVAAQQARHEEAGSVAVESAEISESRSAGEGFVAEISLSYADGSEGTVENVEVYFEDGEYKRHLSESDLDFLREIEADESGQTNSSSEEAAIEDLVYSHYEAIGDGSFSTAYSNFGPTFRASNSEFEWVAEQESFDITGSTVEYVEVLSVSGNSARAAVDVSFEDETGTPSFSLEWELLKEDGAWKLDSVSGGET